MEIKEIIRRWQAGEGPGQIAFGTGLSRSTVRKYLAAAQAEGIVQDGLAPDDEKLVRLVGISLSGPRRVATPRQDQLEPWADQIYQWITNDRLQMTRIHELLAMRGCEVSYPSLRRFIINRNWRLAQRPLVLVGDNSYAVLDLLHCCQSLREPVTLIARLRLDAALYAPAPARQPGQTGRPPLKGARRPALKTILDQPQATWASVAVAWYDGTTRTVELTSQTAVWYRSGKPPVLIRWVLIRDPQGSFATQALLCTDPAADPTQILEWFVLRWQLEVTFQEVRTHLGVETQRQWSDLAIARTTPVLLGIFSWTTLAAHGLQKECPMTQRRAAWYDKPSPTFVDAIALVRRHLWLASEGFSLSVADSDIQELPVALYHRLVDSLAYAA